MCVLNSSLCAWLCMCTCVCKPEPHSLGLVYFACFVCHCLQELRRGTEPAHIHSIAFSKHCDWLAVSSAKGTVHIFALGPAVVTGSDDSDPSKVDGTVTAAMQQQRQQEQQQGGVGGGRHNPTSMISNLVKVSIPIGEALCVAVDWVLWGESCELYWRLV